MNIFDGCPPIPSSRLFRTTKHSPDLLLPGLLFLTTICYSKGLRLKCCALCRLGSIVLNVAPGSTLVVLAQDTHHKKTEAAVEDQIRVVVDVQNDIRHNVLAQY